MSAVFGLKVGTKKAHHKAGLEIHSRWGASPAEAEVHPDAHPNVVVVVEDAADIQIA